MPGWLGDSSPEGFVATLMLDVEPLPCHSTIDYARPDWHSRWMRGLDPKARRCAGALICSRNQGKLPRAGGTPPADRETVFASFAEFIEHHRNARVKSWTDTPADRYGTNQTRMLIGLPRLPRTT